MIQVCGSGLLAVFRQNTLNELDGILCIGPVTEVIPNTVTIFRPTEGSHGNDHGRVLVEGWSSAVSISGASARSRVIGEFDAGKALAADKTGEFQHTDIALIAQVVILKERRQGSLHAISHRQEGILIPAL